MFFIPKTIKRLFGTSAEEPFVELIRILGFKPGNPALYRIALRHVSCSLRDANGFKINNERLEFLGDSVMSTAVSHYLYKHYPTWDEGQLSKRRSAVVKRAVNNAMGREMGLQKLLKIRPEALQNGHDILGNALEALIGAIFMDKGYRRAEHFILTKIFDTYKDLEEDLEYETANYKSVLLEWAQKRHTEVEFRMLQEPRRSGGTFVCAIFVAEKRIGLGRGLTKKESHQQAAHQALGTLNIPLPNTSLSAKK